MKGDRGGFRMVRREQLLQELVHDSYKSQVKLHEPTCCPECRATFHKGRWTWDAAPPGAHEAACPACRRIRDKFPAGYVTLQGEFLDAHGEEIVNLVENCERREKAEHPLERLMSMVMSPGRVEITTTGAHIARDIAESVQHAYKGELELSYNKEDNLLRATWSR
jgi:hypothetical protein